MTTKTPDGLADVKRAARAVTRIETRLDTAKAIRDAAIADAFSSGVGTRPIAAVTGLSNSGVRKILGIGSPQ
jgi:hypothetical protein